MPQQQNRKARAVRQDERETRAVQVAANTYIVRYYPIGCLGGRPRRRAGAREDYWIVPIVLTSPGHGAVGEVGFVAIDARTHEVVGSTQRRAVGQAVRDLKESKRDELDAAFHRARKG